MLRKTFTLLIITLLSSFPLRAQVFDTLRVMHYNLLNYRNVTSFCTEANNNSEQKEANLKTIFHHVKPDIFTVNEMGADWLNPSKLLNNAINTNGETNYKQAEFASNGSSSLANMLFYNSKKLALHSQTDITKDKNGFKLVRSIDLYRLYYKHDASLKKGDTNFLVLAVAHLKAGNTSTDQSSREQEANALMDYLNDNNEPVNYLLCGDLNIQSANEESYQAFTNHSNANIRFQDPVDASATWHNDRTSANLHTQSTRSSSNGCASGGGMDDRFDFILCGNEVMMNDYGLKYMPDSYHALGQDSLRFNGSINDPTNTKVSSAIANALYQTSDHLPVILDLTMESKPASIARNGQLRWSLVNPAYDAIRLESRQAINRIELWSVNGQKIKGWTLNPSHEVELIKPANLSGLYLLKVYGANGRSSTKKLLLTERQ